MFFVDGSAVSVKGIQEYFPVKKRGGLGVAIFTALGAQGIFSADDIVAQIKRLTAFEAAVSGGHIGLVQLVILHVIDHSAFHQHRRMVCDATPVPVGTI